MDLWYSPRRKDSNRWGAILDIPINILEPKFFFRFAFPLVHRFLANNPANFYDFPIVIADKHHRKAGLYSDERPDRTSNSDGWTPSLPRTRMVWMGRTPPLHSAWFGSAERGLATRHRQRGVGSRAVGSKSLLWTIHPPCYCGKRNWRTWRGFV